MGDAVKEQNVYARIGQQDLETRPGSRIASDNRVKLLANALENHYRAMIKSFSRRGCREPAFRDSEGIYNKSDCAGQVFAHNRPRIEGNTLSLSSDIANFDHFSQESRG